jgi:hypothetical protein
MGMKKSNKRGFHNKTGACAPAGMKALTQGLFGCGRGVFMGYMNGTSRYNGRNRVLVHHLRDGIAQQYNILIERLDLPLQFDAVHKVNRDRDMFFAQNVQKRVLQQLAFIAHGKTPK